jgi:hypothetical protein
MGYSRFFASLQTSALFRRLRTEFILLRELWTVIFGVFVCADLRQFFSARIRMLGKCLDLRIVMNYWNATERGTLWSTHLI